MAAPKGKLLVSIPRLSGGGAERVVSTLTRRLTGWEIHLLLFDDRISYPYEGKLHVLDVDVHASLKSRRAAELIRALDGMRRLKRRIEPDVSLSLLLWPNLLNVVTGENERVVVSVRNSRSDRLLNHNDLVRATLYRALLANVYNQADEIVSISRGVARDLADNFAISPGLLRTIYNPVEVSAIERDADHPVPESFEPIFEHPTVVTAGSLSNQKGQWHLIRAFRRLVHQSRRTCRLVILGEGPLEEELLELAAQLDLSPWYWRRDDPANLPDSRVVFAGFRTNPHRFISKGSLFAFPSLYEGLGSVLLEALACRTAILSSDCDFGPREILAPETDPMQRASRPRLGDYGILMPTPGGRRSSDLSLTETEQSWADTLLRLLDAPELRQKLAQKGRQRVEQFRTDAIIEQWEEAFGRTSQASAARGV